MVPRSGSAEDSLIGGVGDNCRCRQEYVIENCRSQEEASGISGMRHPSVYRLAMNCPSQRKRSRETAIERSTETVD